MVPNNGKPRFRICHDIQMLNAATTKEWGPSMDFQVTEYSWAVFFSVFDLPKGFMQISIHEEDQRYFGFYFEGSFFCFKRLPFGFVNSTQYFSIALDQSITEINCRLKEMGLDIKGRCWVTRYVDDVLIGSYGWKEHGKVLQCVVQIMQEHEGIVIQVFALD